MIRFTTEGKRATRAAGTPRRQFARFRPLVARGARQLDGTFEGMAKRLAGLPGRAQVQFVLLEGDARRTWRLEVGKKGCVVSTAPHERPDLEIVTTPETWWRIARGELSPIEAFGRGVLSVAGKLELARVIVRRLAAGERDLLWME